MDKRSLQLKLNQPYSTKTWKEVVQYVFPNVQLFQSPQIIPVENEKIETFVQLGNVQLHDGKILALFELKLKSNVNLLKNRVELNNLVSKHIDQEQAHGVLSIFEQGNDDYRFTFSARATEYDEEEGDFKVKKTDTKRFTYVLGKNESCKTPAERFFELANKKESTDIKAIEEAFNVEKLSKEFFNEYREKYLDFVQYITGKRPKKVGNKWEDEVKHEPNSMWSYMFKGDDKLVRDFVKLLLGRLVFIQFVQKKRWMGVPAEIAGWHNGDVNFLSNAFSAYEHKDLFYSMFLEPLFFETLNHDRSDNLFKVTGTKVPFLNGGLFEKGQLDTSMVNFPQRYFTDLFEFFDRYNFTIDENDLEEREVGIDPEMLGHIFENLLEDNKDKGAFYTPKEIVHYMCQESLKEYLKTALETQQLWPADNNEAQTLEADLQAFVNRKEAGGIIEFDETLATALRDVKICDPAIGSGAFPMGLLNEIYRCMHVLHTASPDRVGKVWNMAEWQPNVVKKNIIQSSIYGVDIEKGAVDIARLRFWLSLIVDEPEPEALPNLDYKIVVGNSLVSKLDDDIIDIDWNLTFNYGKVDEHIQNLKKALNKLSKKQKEFFESEDKANLKLEIRNLKLDILIFQLSLNREKYANSNVRKLDLFSELKPADIKRNLEIELNLKGFENSIHKLEKIKNNPEAPLHFFDWKLDFPEIMNEQVTDKVGFDIVIGNPPYIGAIALSKELREVLNNSSEYKTLHQKWDIYIAFIEKSISMLNHGITSMIVPYPVTNQTYAKKLRDFLLNENDLIEIANLSGTKIFEDATVTNCILFAKNGNSNNKKISISKLINGKISKVYELNKAYLVNDNKTSVWNLSNNKSLIFEGDRYLNINDICFVSVGMVLNADEKKAKGLFVKDDLLSDIQTEINSRKYTEAKYIRKFGIDRTLFLEWGTRRVPSLIRRPTFPELYERPKIMVSKIGKIKATLDETNIFCDQTIRILILWHRLENINNNSIEKSVKKDQTIRRKELEQNSKEFYLEYLLALINSKLINYILDQIRGIGNIDINPEYLKNIPIPKINKEQQLLFTTKINEIFSINEGTLEHDTTVLEQEIDNLVYRIYDLSWDEVRVIDPEFGLSKEAYEAIKLE